MATAYSLRPRKLTFYRPELDVLRFFAFFLVFLTHAMPSTARLERIGGHNLLLRISDGLFRGGVYGVDLFFCLSSFLITTLLLKEAQQTGTIDIRAFYLRRILRIWPLYFIFLLCIGPIIGLFLPSQRLPAGFLLSFLLLSGNWSCAIYGFPMSAVSILWSVSIEEQFYLTWPLIMRRWLKKLPVICVSLLVFSSICRCVFVWLGFSRDFLFCNTLSRLDPIAAGALIAMLLGGTMPIMKPQGRIALIFAGLLAIVVCGAYGSGSGPGCLWTYPLATAASVALLIGATGSDLSGVPSAIRRTLVFAGQISYGLYVFHGVSLEVSRSLFTSHSAGAVRFLAETVVAFLLTVLLSSVSYRVIEEPFLRLKQRFTHVSSQSLSPAASVVSAP